MIPTCDKILIFEWLNGGGLWVDRLRPCDHASLVAQGRQMMTAISHDFRDLGWDVLAPRDSRLQFDTVGKTVPVNSVDELNQTLSEMAQLADQILVIAPETGNRLIKTLDSLHSHRNKLLNPNDAITGLASDKNAMQSWLADQGVPIPFGAPANLWNRKDHSRFERLVVKPADGCGGERLRLWDKSIGDLIPVSSNEWANPSAWRIEEYVEGVAASVSVVHSQNEKWILPPLRQVFQGGVLGQFSHCKNDLSDDLAQRATKLAAQTIAALPEFTGFIGIDCVLGYDRQGDVVVEVNPRITMSYCTLRQHVPFNIVAKMFGHTTATNTKRFTIR